MGSLLEASLAPWCQQHGLSVHVQLSSRWHLFARKPRVCTPLQSTGRAGGGWGAAGDGGEYGEQRMGVSYAEARGLTESAVTSERPPEPLAA